MLSIKQHLRIAIAGYLFLSYASPTIACDCHSIFREIKTAFHQFLHPFKTASLAYQQQEGEMIQGKPLILKGVIVCSGSDLEGKVVEDATHSIYSHVMFLLVNKDNPEESFCYQSCIDAANLFKLVLPQVNVVSYSSAVSNYPGKLFRRDFAFDPGKEPCSSDVIAAVHKYLGRPYERHLTELLGSLTRSNKKGNPSSIFCSELIALVLQDLGYVSRDIPADNYLPKDFAQGSDSFLKLIGGASLGEQILISTS